MAKKVIQTQVRADCRTCAKAGPEKEFVCFCSVLQVGRTVGIRKCNYYVAR